MTTATLDHLPVSVREVGVTPERADDGDDIHLGDIFKEPPRPPTPEPTFATYEQLHPISADKEPRRLTIRLVGSHPLWGHYLWNSGRCLAKYLEHNPSLYAGKNVLELGAGGALPSLITALNGADMTVITDYPDTALVHNLAHNVQANMPSELQSKVSVLGYVWGADVRPLLSSLPFASRCFDLVLLSDLVFNHSQHEALIRTCELVTNPHPRGDEPCALVFYTHHRPHLAEKDLDFFRIAQTCGWRCEKFYEEKQDPMFADDPGDVAVRSTVHGWKLYRQA